MDNNTINNDGIVPGRLQVMPIDSIIFGQQAKEILPKEIRKLKCKRAFLLVSSTLNTNTNEITNIIEKLGKLYVGLYQNVPSHSPRNHVIMASIEALKCNADVLVTVGGGSLSDLAKAMCMVMKYLPTASKEEDLDCFVLGEIGNGIEKPMMPTRKHRDVIQISIPTTLSGGELTPYAGITDNIRNTKHQLFAGIDHVPRLIILDPYLTLHTPEWLFISTGMRSVDHCTECICSLTSNVYTETIAKSALSLLTKGLIGVKKHPKNIQYRMMCQIGMMNAGSLITSRVAFGASHAIGHILGAVGDVPHGHCSCVMLPYVLYYNYKYGGKICQEKQKMVCEAMMESATNDSNTAEEAHVLMDNFIRTLNMPRTLQDVGIRQDQLVDISEKSMFDPWTRTNVSVKFDNMIYGPYTIIHMESSVKIMAPASS